MRFTRTELQSVIKRAREDCGEGKDLAFIQAFNNLAFAAETLDALMARELLEGQEEEEV